MYVCVNLSVCVQYVMNACRDRSLSPELRLYTRARSTYFDEPRAEILPRFRRDLTLVGVVDLQVLLFKKKGQM